VLATPSSRGSGHRAVFSARKTSRAPATLRPGLVAVVYAQVRAHPGVTVVRRPDSCAPTAHGRAFQPAPRGFASTRLSAHDHGAPRAERPGTYWRDWRVPRAASRTQLRLPLIDGENLWWQPRLASRPRLISPGRAPPLPAPSAPSSFPARWFTRAPCWIPVWEWVCRRSEPEAGPTAHANEKELPVFF
jgi:hypothetical protein